MGFMDLSNYGFHGYAVNEDGVVINVWTNSEIKQGLAGPKKNYKTVSICGKYIGVHRLVAMAFIPNPENKPEVDHIDCNPSNNHVSNLRWVTRRENLEHQVEVGSLPPIMSDRIVHAICRDLEEGIGCTEISRKYNVSHDAVFQIKRGENWVHISNQYNIIKPVTYKPKLTEEQVRFICEKHIEGLTTRQISDMTNISMDVVRKITAGVNWRSISKEYF